MRVLVTGGAGFIGSHVVDVPVAAGHAVTVLDRAPASWPNHAARYVDGDVRDPTAWTKAIEGGWTPSRTTLLASASASTSLMSTTTWPTTTPARLWGWGCCTGWASRVDWCWPAAWSSTERVATGAPIIARCDPGPARRPLSTPAASIRPVRRAAAISPASRSPRMPPWIPATSTSPPRSTRNTWWPRTRGNTRRPVRWPCVTTTSTGRVCRSTPRTPAWPALSPAPSTPTERPRSSRMVARPATSSMSATWPGQTWRP